MDALPSRVRAFVAATALPSTPESLRPFYATLPGEGWLIELARTHGRALLGRWHHDEFAAWIGLREPEPAMAKTYRALLRRAEPDREELTQVARRILQLRDPARLPLLQKSPEMLRFRRARELTERQARHRGRPTVTCDVDGPIGRQLEAWRLETRLSVQDWCVGLGVSAPTYRTRLLNECKPGWRRKIEQLAKDGATLHAKHSTPTMARYDPVTRGEMEQAYQVVADDLEALRDELLRGAAPDAPLTGNEVSGEDAYLPLDLYSWLRAEPEEEEHAI